MIYNNFLFSREELVSFIKKGEKTQDGHYWCPRVYLILEINGDIKDEKYIYERNMFKHKLYYTKQDIEIFLETEALLDIDVDDLYRKSYKFYETNKELTILSIKDKIPGKEFTLEELIDTYEFMM